jgi:3-dehydroquinate synthase
MKHLKKLKVDLGERAYPIWIGKGIRDQLPAYLSALDVNIKQKVLLITDSHVGHYYADSLINVLQENGYHAHLYTIPAGEPSKSIEVYYDIMTYAIDQQLDRKSIILALGGGVVGDLAGFVASTFMRGVPFIQLPTTLLAHDSSVGGKVAINHPIGKNMIGSFYQPLAVIFDTETLITLPAREIRSGFAEVLKHGFIWDEAFVNWLTENRDSCLALKEPFISEAIYRGCEVKARVVATDEKEQGLRAILNFGHTFGHALEALGQYKVLTHGEAISIGMVLAARLSERYYQQTGFEKAIASLLRYYELPTSLGQIPWTPEEILDKMFSDKKVHSGQLNMVLLKKMGEAVLVHDVNPQMVLDVIREGRANQ